jgi:hypothetical protein
VQSFSIKESSLLVSALLIVLSALFQNTAGAVFRPLNQYDNLSMKGEIRRSNFSLDRRLYVGSLSLLFGFCFIPLVAVTCMVFPFRQAIPAHDVIDIYPVRRQTKLRIKS